MGEERFVQVPVSEVEALAKRDLTGGAFRVFLWLCGRCRANGRGRRAYTTRLSYIVAETGLSRRWVEYALKELEEDGLVERTGRLGMPTTFRVLPLSQWRPPDPKRPEKARIIPLRRRAQ